MNKIICLICLLFLQGLTWAEAPATQPATVTGTLGTDLVTNADDIGHCGVLLVRSEHRWKEFADRAGAMVPFNNEIAHCDFTKQVIVLIYADHRHPFDEFVLTRSDVTVQPPQMAFQLRWDNRKEAQDEAGTKFMYAIIPSAAVVKTTLSSQPTNPDRSRIVTEFSAILGGKDGGDIVDGLQAAITPKAAVIKPGENILIDFTLHLADPGEAKPERFGTAPKKLFVWDAVYSEGYRNYAFFVTTPDGKTTLLRRKEISNWRKNVPHPVEIRAQKPYHVPYEEPTGDTFLSLQSLGLDTNALGTYIVTGLYEETGSVTQRGGEIWGGSISTNTITVEVKK